MRRVRGKGGVGRTARVGHSTRWWRVESPQNSLGSSTQNGRQARPDERTLFPPGVVGPSSRRRRTRQRVGTCASGSRAPSTPNEPSPRPTPSTCCAARAGPLSLRADLYGHGRRQGKRWLRLPPHACATVGIGGTAPPTVHDPKARSDGSVGNSTIPSQSMLSCD